jgi:hypothetical protein
MEVQAKMGKIYSNEIDALVACKITGEPQWYEDDHHREVAIWPHDLVKQSRYAGITPEKWAAMIRERASTRPLPQQPVFFGPKPILFGLVRFYFLRWHCWKPMRRCFEGRDEIGICDRCGHEINLDEEERITMGDHLV